MKQKIDYKLNLLEEQEEITRVQLYRFKIKEIRKRTKIRYHLWFPSLSLSRQVLFITLQ